MVTKLRAAGAVIIGKTVTTEFAYFTPGKTRNPRDLERTPGGSSSGSAAAVAAGMVPLALGTQTNGSVIRPAAFCGVFAIKPSHGLISRAGVLTLSRTLDHVGTIRALDRRHCTGARSALPGYDPDDPDTRHRDGKQISQRSLDRRIRPLDSAAGLCDARRCGTRRTLDTREAFEDLAKGFRRSLLRARFAGPLCCRLGLASRESWPSRWRTISAADRYGRRQGQQGQFRDLDRRGRRKVTATELSCGRCRRPSAIRAALEECIQQTATPSSRPRRAAWRQRATATGDPVFCTLWTLPVCRPLRCRF